MAATLVGRRASSPVSPGPMPGAMDLGIADHGERACREQPAQIAIALLADTAKPVLAPLEFCLGTSPTQAEKSRADRKALGSARLATSAVASAGPTPGIASSRLLVAFDRCQAMMRRSNSRIWVFSTDCPEQQDTRVPFPGAGGRLYRQRYPTAARRPGVRRERRSRTRQGRRGSS